jgi:hypothetical protein
VLKAVLQKWRFSVPQTHLWLIKVWFFASTFVVKIANYAKPETIISMSYWIFLNFWLETTALVGVVTNKGPESSFFLVLKFNFNV